MYHKLSQDNYTDMIEIKHKLFPESNSDEDYINYFDNKVKSNYYLVSNKGVPCAIVGWYEYDSNNVFVGWFGVLEDYRKQGIGTKILEYIMGEVKKLNYKYLRVYTDKVVNYASTKLYDKYFDIKENYTYPDKLGKTGNFIIYTKYLKDKKEKWNNMPLKEDDNYNF